MRLNKWAESHAAAQKLDRIESIVKRVIVDVENIDGELYASGTLQKVEAAWTVALAKVALAKSQLDGKVDLAFAGSEQRIDVYLDWYYSLSGEYGRLATYLVGDIEGYMENKLSQYLAQDEALKEVATAVAIAVASNDAVMAEYEEAVKAIKAVSRSTSLPEDSRVIKSASLREALSFHLT